MCFAGKTLFLRTFFLLSVTDMRNCKSHGTFFILKINRVWNQSISQVSSVTISYAISLPNTSASSHCVFLEASPRGRRCQFDPLEGDSGFFSNTIPSIPHIFSDVFILMKYSYFYFTARGRRCQWDPLEGDGGFYSNTLPFNPPPIYFRMHLYWWSIRTSISPLEGVDVSGIR